jgi:alpha-beta hydrolase superfamily lysophospholipase
MLVRWLLPTNKAKAVVFHCHGLCEHTGSRLELIYLNALAQAGYIVVAADQVGHGRTAKNDDDRGFIADAKYWQDDLLWLIDTVAEGKLAPNFTSATRGLPFFISGFSFGGNVVVHVGCRITKGELKTAKKEDFKGAVLVSAGLKDAYSPNFLVVLGLKGLLKLGMTHAKLGPNLVMDDGCSVGYLEEAKADPLFYYGGVRLQTGFSLMTTLEGTLALMVEVDFPFAAFHGGSDPETPLEGVDELMTKSKTKAEDKKKTVYPKATHTLFVDPNAASICQDIIAWLDSRLK